MEKEGKQAIFSIDAVRFECSFFEVPVIHLDTAYTCLPTVHYDDEEPSRLTAVEGDHAEGKFNEDVRFLRIYLQDLPVLLSNIENFFSSLEGLMVSTSNLLEIKADDLRPFLQLKTLFINHNFLKSIDGDLLAHSPNLVAIEFKNNKIENIGPGFLEKLLELEHLEEINFSGNMCIDIHAKTPSEVLELLGEIQELCPPMEFTTTTDPTTTTTEEITSPEHSTENVPGECTCTPRNPRSKRARKFTTLSVVRPV